MPETNLTRALGTAQSIDFANKFGTKLGDLTEILGVHRKISMPVGTVIKTYQSTVTLADGTVEPGAVIPLSKVELTDGPTQELKWDKRRKAVPAEDIQKYGFERAINITDNKLLTELQKNLRTKLFENLDTGTGVATGAGIQAALAQAWGKVQVAFEDDAIRTIAFVNPLDVADYLAKANITIQNAFGMSYVENFLGVDLVMMSSRVAKGTAYVTAAENLVLAYADVNGEIDKAFDFVKDSTGVIGVTKDINKQRLTAETITLSGLVLYAEILDGVIVTTITEVVPSV